MSRPPLLVPVPTKEVLPQSLSDALMSIIHECVAAQPVSVMVVWSIHGQEVPQIRSVPDCKFTRKGYIDRMFELTHPSLTE